MRTIEDAIKEHLRAVREYGIPAERLVGVFVYGSQNYKCDLPGSDVDTKAIYIPSIEEAVLKRTKPNYVKELANGEHCEIMDIRHFVDNLKKQNINFVEVLYTEHFYLNPYLADSWLYYFINNRERIAHYDMDKALKSISGQAVHTIKQDMNDGKKLANGRRLFYFLRHYMNGELYKDCLIPEEKEREEILRLKQLAADGKKIFGNDHAEALIEAFEELQSYKCNYPAESKETLDTLLDTAIMTMLKEANYDAWYN